jgi:hypothetical protein
MTLLPGSAGGVGGNQVALDDIATAGSYCADASAELYMVVTQPKPLPRPVGRPTKHSPRLVERLCRAIAEGMPIKGACIVAGICMKGFNTITRARETGGDREDGAPPAAGRVEVFRVGDAPRIRNASAGSCES